MADGGWRLNGIEMPNQGELAQLLDWLGAGPELSVLSLLGLFDRPAEAAALVALRAEPIAGLTDGLGLEEEPRWKEAVARLARARLIRERRGGLDAPPWVREFFGGRLRQRAEEVWKAGHSRLFEHYQRAAPEYPETLKAMMPLYAAMVHGCRAGRHQEACEQVYRRRVLRGSEHFSWHSLGAFSAEISALAAFFDRPWSEPSAKLDESDQAWLFNEVGMVLRVLGRLSEAVAPMRLGLEARLNKGNWSSAAVSAGNLCELTLTLGEVARAVEVGAQSVEWADLGPIALGRSVNRATYADALHQAGRWRESAARFAEAERRQMNRQSWLPRLYSVPGFRYCDLLLSAAEPEDGAGLEGLAAQEGTPMRGVQTPRYGETSLRDEEAERKRTIEWRQRYRLACDEVRDRVRYALGVASTHGWVLDIALDHLSLGRAHLGIALTSSTPNFRKAAHHLEQAVVGLRRANQQDQLPRGLLARAALNRFQGDFPAAQADLTEVSEIASRGKMRLFETDAHLEWARLELARGEIESSRQHLEQARVLVDATGYERRRREVEWLARRRGETPRHTAVSATPARPLGR